MTAAATVEAADEAFIKQPHYRGDVVLAAAAAGVRCGLAIDLADALDHLAEELDRSAVKTLVAGTPLLSRECVTLSEKARNLAEERRAVDAT